MLTVLGDFTMAGVAAQTEQSHNAILEKEGKYLTFALANEEYGLEILKVREIIGYMEITAVPQTPQYVKGVINLRGRVIPVMDLRLRFALPERPYDDRTCIIIVNVDFYVSVSPSTAYDIFIV